MHMSSYKWDPLQLKKRQGNWQANIVQASIETQVHVQCTTADGTKVEKNMATRCYVHEVDGDHALLKCVWSHAHV